MPHHWFNKTIARKLAIAFFSIFLLTYLATSMVVESAIRSAVTDAEIRALFQLAQDKQNSINAIFEHLSTDLHAWSKLNVMNDIASGDIDKNLAHTLENLKSDYAIEGQIYAFNAAGQLVASSDPKQKNKPILPDIWESNDPIKFVNKHTNPLDGEEIVALITPITANFLANYKLGTLVLVYHWKSVISALPAQALILYHPDLLKPQESALNSTKVNEPITTATHEMTLVLLGSTLANSVPRDILDKFERLNGVVQIGNIKYIGSSILQKTGLLSGWEMVLLRDPDSVYQVSRAVIIKLVLFGFILSLPLLFAIRWLSKLITTPLSQLTQFVSEISGAQDLSKQLEIQSKDEIGILASDFNRMTSRLERESKAHREADMRLRATIDNALDAVVQMNADGIVTGWNAQAENIFGWPRNEAIGKLLHELIIPPQYRENHAHGMKHFMSAHESAVLNSRIEITSIRRDGHEFPVELAVTAIEVDGEQEFSAFIRDITNKKESEDIIWKQANFDKVTGLPNRHMFHDRLEQEIKKAHRSNLQMGLLFIDLDHFKEINDTLGHDMGDILLKEASRRISSCVRESDTVARLGGDEFTVILSEVDDNKIIDRVAQAILKVLAEPFQLGDEVGQISGSIGITLYPNDAGKVEDLIKNADQAMYVAKNMGRNKSSYFTAALQEAAQDRRRLIFDLRAALASNQFSIFFQPIVNLASGRIHKAEALIRWHHPERGMISPVEFIPIAEETGLINEIGSWAFKESARWAKLWQDQFAVDFQVSVNVSPVQFLSVEYSFDTWNDYLKDIGLSGQNVVIEITEGLLLKAATGVTDKLLKFRDSGIQVAIDDFGTGYSSLSYLKKFDIDYLKIDKSFVDGIVTNSNDMALSEAIIVMAHKLGLKVIAEGVENEGQRKALINAGCDYAQGYLYSKPVAPEIFETLLMQNS